MPSGRVLCGDPGGHRLGEMAEAETHKFTDNAEEIAGTIAERARNYADKAQEAVENVKPYVGRSMSDQPMATLAVASVFEFVLGALLEEVGRACLIP